MSEPKIRKPEAPISRKGVSFNVRMTTISEYTEALARFFAEYGALDCRMINQPKKNGHFYLAEDGTAYLLWHLFSALLGRVPVFVSFLNDGFHFCTRFAFSEEVPFSDEEKREYVYVANLCGIFLKFRDGEDEHCILLAMPLQPGNDIAVYNGQVPGLLRKLERFCSPDVFGEPPQPPAPKKRRKRKLP